MQPQSSALQYYYLVDGQPKGPVDAGRIWEMVGNGSVSPAVMVAQVGWNHWAQAAQVWPNLPVPGAPPPAAAVPPAMPQQRSAAPPPLPASTPTPMPEQLSEVPIRCVAGPDVGKMLLIGGTKMTVGRQSGIGATDPLVANEHAVMSWRDQKLTFQAYPGLQLLVNGAGLNNGSMALGQQFVLGSSTWQVGASQVDVKSLIGSLASRLNTLASTEKLEGFSLKEMFSEVFKKRTPEEVEEYFVVGTSRTTPAIEDVPTGWPKPWFFARILLFTAVVFVIFRIALAQFGNLNLVPGMIMMGALAVPLATVFLFFELNAPRNVSFHQVLMLVCFGGIVSLFISLIGFNFGLLNWLGASDAGIIEETGKILTVVLVVRQARYKYILNGLLFGAAVGAGFGIFETAGYAFNILLKSQNIGVMINNIILRSFLAPFMHVAWTAIAAGALWRVKGDRPFRPQMMTDVRFWRAFLIPVVLHMIWNSPLGSIVPFMLVQLTVGVVAWYVLFAIAQQGLHQVRDEQREKTKVKLKNTEDFALATGQFSAAEIRQTVLSATGTHRIAAM